MNKLDIKNLLKTLSLEEKASLLCGAKVMETRSIPEKGIPPLRMSDGPNGVRKVNDNHDQGFDLDDALSATSFPTGSILSCSWNKELFYSLGEAIAKECLAYDVDVLLGPAINIKRNPLCGRNFEYLSEDPILSGILAREYVKGVQSTGVIATPKHFACNNNEKWRTVGNSIVDERALREIYLKPFEIVIKESNPGMLMTSYNLINGTYASENEHLFNILRNEWGYEGLAVTDWGGINNRLLALKCGQDLEMPGCNQSNIDLIIEGYKNNLISMEDIDISVTRILKAINSTRDNKTIENTIFDDHIELCEKFANEAIVLLKNKDHILPLNKDKQYAVIGKYFTQPRFQGGGSSLINNARYDRPMDAFNRMRINYQYALGYEDNTDSPDTNLENDALEKAKDVDVILLFIGQSDYEESESYDRSSMRLPPNQLSLIDKLKTLNKPIVVILFGGSQTEIPYEDDVSGIIFVGLPGQCSGNPIYETLFGMNNPSGKLSETWMKNYIDHITSKTFSSHPEELYKESIYVGYRYTESKGQEVRYPFGYGLSYTEFEYKDLKVNIDKEKNIHVKVKISNIGDMDGHEIVQVYTSLENSKVYRPKKELKGFEKVFLKAGETKEVEVIIPYNYLEVFDVGQNKSVVESGKYLIMVGKNVRDIIFQSELEIKGEELNEMMPNVYFDINKIADVKDEEFEAILGYKLPPIKVYKKPYDMYTPLCMMNSLGGRVLQNELKKYAVNIMKEADKYTDPLIKRRKKLNGYMAAFTVETACLRFMVYASTGTVTMKRAEGILDIANGHWIRGLKKIKQ